MAVPLPHLDAIQRSFGPHDVGGVRAHVGGDAATAARSIGASAYATGNDVAFASPPDLRTAAHEAAHVVQQREGLSLSGGVGRAGDAYEQHADAVADLVVRGESATALLESRSGGGGAAAIQRTPAPAAQGVPGVHRPQIRRCRGSTGPGSSITAMAPTSATARPSSVARSFATPLCVNMAALPPALAAAELFGATRDAFTGATRGQDGYFRSAADGTLFLDEIGAAPAELLRALETSEIYALGAQRPERVDVRIVAATDRSRSENHASPSVLMTSLAYSSTTRGTSPARSWIDGTTIGTGKGGERVRVEARPAQSMSCTAAVGSPHQRNHRREVVRQPAGRTHSEPPRAAWAAAAATPLSCFDRGSHMTNGWSVPMARQRSARAIDTRSASTSPSSKSAAQWDLANLWEHTMARNYEVAISGYTNVAYSAGAKTLRLRNGSGLSASTRARVRGIVVAARTR
jgi:hypothetical protein